ncbi:hypothetical protein BT93_H3396 [Corymbia citriodora subsp. variegata]|nr:hypothetical protein BT93_H3396 [Corymbia citriodora subsp. variegata]
MAIDAGTVVLVSLVFSSAVHGHVAAQHDPGPSPNPAASSHSLSPATALIVVFLVLLFLAIGFSSVYIRRCSDSPPPLPVAALSTPAPRFSSAIGTALFLASRRPGLNQHLLDVLPTFAYGEAKGREDWVEGAEECPVCLSEFDESDMLRLLPWCGHAFHAPCINKWLAKHAACPVCRSTVAVE